MSTMNANEYKTEQNAQANGYAHGLRGMYPLVEDDNSPMARAYMRGFISGIEKAEQEEVDD